MPTKTIKITTEKLERAMQATRVLNGADVLDKAEPVRIAIAYEIEDKTPLPHIVLIPTDKHWREVLALAERIIQTRREEAKRVLTDIGVDISAPKAHASPQDSKTVEDAEIIDANK